MERENQQLIKKHIQSFMFQGLNKYANPVYMCMYLLRSPVIVRLDICSMRQFGCVRISLVRSGLCMNAVRAMSIFMALC